MRTSRRMLLSSFAACLHAASSFNIDKAALSRVVSVIGVGVDSAHCADFMRAAQPHLINFRGVHAVRKSSDEPGHRVVLLDETLQNERDLPDALQQAIASASGHVSRCDVEIGYDNLSAQEALRQLLPAGIGVPTGFEQVGHIVHLNLQPEQRPHSQIIGEVLLDKLRPRIRTVVNKVEEISSEFRTLPLELVAGDDDFDVTVQHGKARLRFAYDKVYWSSRLHTEHERIAKSFAPGDVVWDLFAGVGPFAVHAGKRGVRVLANDLNPHCCDALLGNVASNKLRGLVHVYNLDAATFAREATAGLQAGDQSALAALRMRAAAPVVRRGRESAPASGSTDAEEAAALEAESCMPAHILLNLPADSIRFLGALRELSDLLSSEPSLTPPVVHCYSFTRLEEPGEQLAESRERVAEALGRATPPPGLSVRSVRSVAPGKEFVVIEFPLARGRES